MRRGRCFHYSASSAVTLTALATLCVEEGGMFLLVPGLVANLLLEWLLSLLLTDGDLYPVPRGGVLVWSAAFYFVCIYFVLLMWARFREG